MSCECPRLSPSRPSVPLVETTGSDGLGRGVAIIVQARMGSTRLPGKVLAPVLGRPLLAYQLERLGRVRAVATIVVATTNLPADDVIASLCSALGVQVFRGSEHDVLSRFAGASAEVVADIIVRSTADCPLIDPTLVDEVVALVESGTCDYASNTLERTYPRGLDVEAMTREALGIAAAEAIPGPEQEHVTPFIYSRPERFRLCGVRAGRDLSNERWTVDTPEDFELIRRILEELYPRRPDFGWEDVVEVLDRNPEWRLLNANVEQNPVFQHRSQGE